jgi:hypothetical protein
MSWYTEENESSRIKLPRVIRHLENEIEIKTLDDAMKFEMLMEIYKKYSWKEINDRIEKSGEFKI